MALCMAEQDEIWITMINGTPTLVLHACTKAQASLRSDFYIAEMKGNNSHTKWDTEVSGTRRV